MVRMMSGEKVTQAFTLISATQFLYTALTAIARSGDLSGQPSLQCLSQCQCVGK